METTLLSRANSWARRSINLKLFTIGILILVLFIPSAAIEGLINERAIRQQEAAAEIGSKWGGKQVLGGPVLNVPYEVHWKTGSGEVKTRTELAYSLPDTLNISGKVTTEIRYRGIFQAVLYNGDLLIEGSFIPPNFLDWKIDEADIRWEEASISVSVSDMKGIRRGIDVTWVDSTYRFNPGIECKGPFQSGISVRTPITGKQREAKIPFSFQVSLNGSEDLRFLPLGRETQVNLNSPWSNPSFQGAFLPEARDVADSGFSASWRVLDFNRNYSQQWLETGTLDPRSEIFASAFGVELRFPVDGYQKTLRSHKYDFSFICLTFAAFFFIEVLNDKRLHPVQYLLIGFAICLFYVLLLSLSEHLGFGAAYLLASTAITTLITAYSRSIFSSTLLTAIIAITIGSLYTYLYVLLQLQDYSLLIGSIGLFVILATVMYLTNKIDWYRTSP